MDRYCSVFNMLYPGVQIRERYEIADETGGAVATGDVYRSKEEPSSSAAV